MKILIQKFKERDGDFVPGSIRIAVVTDTDFDNALLRSGAFERMTPEMGAVRKEAVRAPSERARLTDEIKKKDEMIKALADALENQRATFTEQAWHSTRCMENRHATCTEDCTQARSVLRLAGRSA